MGQRDINELLRFLDTHTAMSLATEDDGRPWASILFYARDGARLYFYTWPEKRLVANFRRNPRVAATVVEEGDSIATARGVQIAGTVAEVTSALEKTKARALLIAKLAQHGGRTLLGGDVQKAMGRLSDAKLYRMEIERAWLTDNSLGLGHRIEIEMRRSQDS